MAVWVVHKDITYLKIYAINVLKIVLNVLHKIYANNVLLTII